MGKKEGPPSLPDNPKISPEIEKNHKTFDFPTINTSEIGQMRTQLIKELKTPFIERVQTSSSDILKQAKIESFDERVMTLPDKEIFDLYVDYVKVRKIKNEKTKETVRNSILERLESSFFSDGWGLRRYFNRR